MCLKILILLAAFVITPVKNEIVCKIRPTWKIDKFEGFYLICFMDMVKIVTEIVHRVEHWLKLTNLTNTCTHTQQKFTSYDDNCIFNWTPVFRTFETGLIEIIPFILHTRLSAALQLNKARVTAPGQSKLTITMSGPCCLSLNDLSTKSGSQPPKLRSFIYFSLNIEQRTLLKIVYLSNITASSILINSPEYVTSKGTL